MYDIFGKYGAIRQIRMYVVVDVGVHGHHNHHHHTPYSHRGNAKDTRGTAYVVYEDIYDAKAAVDHLSGFNVANRYLIVLYYNPKKQNRKIGLEQKEQELRDLQAKYGVDGEQHAPKKKNTQE